MKLSNGFHLTESFDQLKTLSLRQLATLRKYSPKALMLLQPFDVILKQLGKQMSTKEVGELTLEQMVQKYGQ